MNKDILMNEQDFCLKVLQANNTGDSQKVLEVIEQVVTQYKKAIRVNKQVVATENDMTILCHCMNTIIIAIETHIVDIEKIEPRMDELFWLINSTEIGVELFDKYCNPMLQALSGNQE